MAVKSTAGPMLLYMSNSKSEVRWVGCSLSEAESRRISSSSWSDTNHSDSEPPTSLRGISCWCSCCSNTYPDRPDQNRQWKLTIKVHQVREKIFRYLSSRVTNLISTSKTKPDKNVYVHIVEAKIGSASRTSVLHTFHQGNTDRVYSITHARKRRWNIERVGECKVDFNSLTVNLLGRGCSNNYAGRARSSTITSDLLLYHFVSFSFLLSIFLFSRLEVKWNNLSIKVHPKNNGKLVHG